MIPLNQVQPIPSDEAIQRIRDGDHRDGHRSNSYIDHYLIELLKDGMIVAFLDSNNGLSFTATDVMND